MARKNDETTTVPYALPKFGKLRGTRVRLADAQELLSKKDLGDVTAVIGGNAVRPWRFASAGDEVRVLSDRVLV
jgi:hypothetical protein